MHNVLIDPHLHPSAVTSPLYTCRSILPPVLNDSKSPLMNVDSMELCAVDARQDGRHVHTSLSLSLLRLLCGQSM